MKTKDLLSSQSSLCTSQADIYIKKTQKKKSKICLCLLFVLHETPLTTIYFFLSLKLQVLTPHFLCFHWVWLFGLQGSKIKHPEFFNHKLQRADALHRNSSLQGRDGLHYLPPSVPKINHINLSPLWCQDIHFNVHRGPRFAFPFQVASHTTVMFPVESAQWRIITSPRIPSVCLQHHLEQFVLKTFSLCNSPSKPCQKWYPLTILPYQLVLM